MSFPDRALRLLREMTGPTATFRPHQLEAIEELVVHRRRVLLVERTGFGKSAVYFITTRLLREEGAGATILISPLLALMRNQVEMAARLGLRAETVNSSNRQEWERIFAAIQSDEIDLLLISPERLNNPTFRREQLPALARGTGMLVIDEVHCISDWGHDFRPDYRRLARMLTLLPKGVPVLGTTATANDRVVADVEEQLGAAGATYRGSLARESLVLGVKRLAGAPERLAYLAAAIPTFGGSGIVYCLTIEATRLVASWLEGRKISSVAYSGDTPAEERLEIERRLLDNDVKVVVATSALGMGFDKPDLAFVVHYQSPGSPIAYYQQVGRAGRAVDEAVGLLLSGHEDRDIQDYFIDTAFPSKERAEEVVDLLEAQGRALSTVDIMQRVNVRRSRLEAMLKILEVEGAVERSGSGWLRTLAPWTYDSERTSRVTAARRAEQAAMESYATSTDCRMSFLRRELDDMHVAACGRCDNCTHVALFDVDVDPRVLRAATEHVRSQDLYIEPRKQWAKIGVATFGGKIEEEERLARGRVLGLYGDGGWGGLVKEGKWEHGRFDETLVDASAELISKRWRPDPCPEWVTCIPSTRHPGLVPGFAEALAQRLGLSFRAAVAKIGDTALQKDMENSHQQLANVHAAFEVVDPVSAPVLLVDDLVDSGWTLTVAGVALRRAGVPVVYPFALARRAGT